MKTIMIVEDQPDVQKLLGVALQAEDRRILHCQHAEEAWTLLRRERPEVILLDIMMPGEMDGMNLLQQVRRDRQFDGIKIIVISARTQEWDKSAARAAGADGFIAKPFRLDRLRHLLQEILESERS